jgi:hypothetical protein
MGEDLLFERVTADAEERHLSQNTLTFYPPGLMRSRGRPSKVLLSKLCHLSLLR